MRRKFNSPAVRNICCEVNFVVEKNKLMFFRSLAEFESSLEKMLVVFREWKDRPATAGAEQMKTFLRTKLPSDNQLTLQ